jgi:hypothetical protein
MKNAGYDQFSRKSGQTATNYQEALRYFFARQNNVNTND